MSAETLAQRITQKPEGIFGYFALSEERDLMFHALKEAKLPFEKVSASKGLSAVSFALSTNDLFGTSPMLIIEDIEGLSTKQVSELEKLLKGAKRGALLISSKASSAIKRLFSLCEMTLSLIDEKPWQKRSRRKAWVKSNTLGLKFTNDALEAFVDLSENDMILCQEMAKLKAYTEGKKDVDLSTLDELCQKEVADTGFKAFEYACNRKWKPLSILGESFSKEPSALSSLLMQLRYSCNQALEVKESSPELLGKLRPNLSPWRVKKVLEQVKSCSFDALSKATHFLLEMEVMQRTSKLPPKQVWDLTFASLQKIFS